MLFAFQVFGLMIGFPLYVGLEMNHGTGRLQGNNSLPAITGKMIKKGIGQSPNTVVENRDIIFYLTQKMMLLNTRF